MNDQEKVSRAHYRHIGEIMMARHTGKTIIRTLAKIPSCATEIAYDEIDFGALCEYPEHYSIKKEPRFIYVNVYKESAGSFRVGDAHNTIERCEEMCSSNTVIVAHPIEIPEEAP